MGTTIETTTAIERIGSAGTLVPLTPRPDIALLSLATTPGLVRSDAAFASLVRAAGATCAVTTVAIGVARPLRRQVAVTDLVEALAARRSAHALDARATVYSTVTAALLQPPRHPSAVRFDSPAALNRAGASGLWQRAAERRALAAADLLLPLTDAAAAAIPRASAAPRVVLPIPIDEVAPAPERDIDAVTYAAYPRKRGLELAIAAWAVARPAAGRLVVGGADRDKGLRWLRRCGVEEPPGVEWAGPLERSGWLATLARARVFVNASRWDEFGLAPLEALSAGALLATLPTPGPFAALPLAGQLDPALVAGEMSAAALAGVLSAALAVEAPTRADYARRATELLRPFRHEALVTRVRDEVLPALGVQP